MSAEGGNLPSPRYGRCMQIGRLLSAQKAQTLSFAVMAAINAWPCAVAAAPRRSVPIPITLDGRNSCWTYVGPVDGFTMHVSRDERLLISASGVANFSDGRRTWKLVKPRNITVFVIGIGVIRPKHGSVYALPSTGKLMITLGPVAIYGAPSVVAVCRSPDDTALNEDDGG